MPQHKINTNIQESEPEITQLKYLGRYIREVRICESLTQVEAANLCGISIGCLQHMEKGNNVTIATLIKVAESYDISIADFFSDLD